MISKAFLTDGDLRRLLLRGDLGTTRVGDVASATPLTIGPDQLMADAEARMQEARVQCLVVTGENGHVEGIVQIFEEPSFEPDLLASSMKPLRFRL